MSNYLWFAADKQAMEMVSRRQTIPTYLRIVQEFGAHTEQPLNALGPDDLRDYHAHLLKDRKRAGRTAVQQVAAIRFLYCKTLRRAEI